jgi:glycogen debranching enzyme
VIEHLVWYHPKRLIHHRSVPGDALAGHCLWCGIVPRERAKKVVDRLMAPDMWTGWGIRTLSADHRAFNPYNYQTGSVWPHDNAIIAMGFKFYGFGPEAARVAHDVSVAASHFLLNQLPELYTAAERTETNFPVQYWARTCRKRGPPARSSCWFRPCWDFSPMPPAINRRFRLGCRI